MIGTDFKYADKSKRLVDALDRSAFRSLGHAAATIRKEAVASIVRSSEPSPPGSPVHTSKGQAKRAFRFDVDKAKQEAVVGPRFSMVGLSMEAHEKGKSLRGDNYAARPTVGPALTNNLDRFAGSFAGSLN